jgi:hypothetical protein
MAMSLAITTGNRQRGKKKSWKVEGMGIPRVIRTKRDLRADREAASAEEKGVKRRR